MASTPLQIGLRIQYPSGTNLANVNATVSNETTDQSTTKTTNSSGEVIFNLGSTVDFSKGWNIGNKISVVSLYTGFQQSFSFTIPAVGTTLDIKDDSNVSVGSFVGGIGMSNGTLVLVAVPSLPSIRYYTGQEFLDYFDLKTRDQDAEHGISLLQLAKVGEAIEHDIDSDCRTKFDDNNGAGYATTVFSDGESPEYHDAKRGNQAIFFTRYRPIYSMTTFAVDSVAEGGTPSWTTLTEAAYDIVVSKQTGRVKIIDSGSYPEIGAHKVRMTYTLGRSTTPKDIKMLAILETGMKLLGFNFIQNKLKDFGDEDMPDISYFKEFRERIINKYRNNNF